MRLKKDKEELLEKRRAKLRKLLDEEDQSYQIELMVRKNLHIEPPKPAGVEVPTEVLKDVNNQFKQREEEKRKREAEIKLYHQWRTNNPIVRQFESKYKLKDLKLSWLDQQIEKRMQQESEERECKRMIKEQEERLKREKEKEEQRKKEIDEKRVKLKKQLDRQVEELKDKQKVSDELRKKEAEEVKHKMQIDELEEKAKEEEKIRLAKENALFNIKQHKMKLKQKAVDVEEALASDKALLLKLKKLELEELIEDKRKKNEIKRSLDEFLCIVKEQQELEKQRQRQLEFLFDSEARAVYEKQLEIWKNEENARKKLLKEVLSDVNKQVQDNINKNKQKQREILLEREEMMHNIEQYDKELQALKDEEEKRKRQCKKMIDEDVKLKTARKKEQENIKLKEIDEELERVRKEEERLHREILAIQRRQGPIRPSGRTRFFY